MSREKFVTPILPRSALRSTLSALRSAGKRVLRSTIGLIASTRAEIGVRRLSRIWQSPSLPMKSARLEALQTMFQEEH